MAFTLIVLSFLYILTLVILGASVRLTLALPVPEPIYRFNEAQKEKLERAPWWLNVTLIGGGAAGLLSFDLDKLSGPLSAPSVSAWLALFLYLLIFLMAAACLKRAPRRWTLMIAVILSAICGGAAVLWWSAYPNWLTGDLVSILLVLYTLLMLQPLWSFRVMAGAAVIVAVGYDAVQTWASAKMVVAAQHELATSLPGIFLLPTHFGLSPGPGVALGAGDLVFPGMLIVVAGRVAQRSGCPKIGRYAFGGYVVSLFVAMAVLVITNLPLPALVFTIPGVIVGTWWAARRESVMDELTRRQVLGDPNPRPGGSTPPSSPGTAS